MNRILNRIFPARRRRQSAPRMIGQDAIRAILACTKPDAIRAKTSNYRRSIQFILRQARS